VRLLAAHDRSQQEVRSRLAAQGASPAVIAATLRRLQREGYVDDRRLARNAAESAARRGHGSERLRAALTARGVAAAAIDEALRVAFTDETELARQTLARRFSEALERPADRARAARYLLRRGFPEAVVIAVLGDEFS
jgi:regulatory protein